MNPKPQGNGLDEILAVFANWDDPHEFSDGWEVIQLNRIATAKQQIQALIAEANKAGYRKGYEHCLVGKKPTEQLKEQSDE